MSKELIERLERAEAGSRELDSAIVEALSLAPEGAVRMHGVEHGTWATGPYETWVCPKFTTSLDAALALAERVLPGRWIASIQQWPTRTLSEAAQGKEHWGPDHWRALFVEYEAPCRNTSGVAYSAPMAVCIAILKTQGAQQ